MWSPKNSMRTGLGWMGMVLLSACVSVPTQELSDAHQAIQAAEQAGANELLRGNLQRARLQLEQAETAADTGDYKAARDNALAAKRVAMTSRHLSILLQRTETVLQEPRALGVVWNETEKLYRQALEAADLQQTGKVESLLLRVQQQGRLALNQYYLERADQNLRRLQAAQLAVSAVLQSQLSQALAAYDAGQGRTAYAHSVRLLRATGLQP